MRTIQVLATVLVASPVLCSCSENSTPSQANAPYISNTSQAATNSPNQNKISATPNPTVTNQEESRKRKETAERALSPPDENTKISLSGEAMRGFDAYSSQPTYLVKLHLKNIGASPLMFDMAEGRFFASNGQGVRLKTTRTNGGVTKLKAGEGKDFEFETDGYTTDLLGYAKGGPLFFHLTLFLRGSVTAGPYHTSLPKLDNLPDYYQRRKAQGGHLKFEDANGVPVY